MNEPLLPAPLGVGDLLDAGLRWFRAGWRPLLTVAALLLGPPALLAVLLTGTARAGPGALLVQPLQELLVGPDQLQPTPVALETELLLFAVNLFAAGFSTLALLRMGLAHWRGETLPLRTLLRQALRALPAYAGMTILVAVVTGTLMLLVLWTVAMLFGFGSMFFLILVGDGSSGPMVVLLQALLTVGALVMVVVTTLPAAWTLGRWVVAPVVLLEEGQGSLSALGRSWNLTLHRSRAGAGLIYALFFLTFGLSMAPLLLLVMLSPLVTVTAAPLWLPGLLAAVSFLTSIGLAPLTPLVQILCYFDLRHRNEARGLELRVAAVEASVGKPVSLPVGR
jgi:hypothetical protein